MVSTTQVYESTKNLSVLFVEDDIDFLSQTEILFSNLFLSVSTAQNGLLGLESFKNKIKSSKPYDLVITDVNMPIMNGIEMIQEIQKIVPSQPIIVTSAHNDAHYLISLLNLGISSFIIKPLKEETLNTSLFNVAKSINNEYLVKKHYDEIKNLNNELLDKNIALEKSMRIIEGLHNKNQISINSDLHLDNITQTKPITQDNTSHEEKNISPQKKYLNNIELIISNIALKHQQNNIEDKYFKELSDEVNKYADSLSDKSIYIDLKNLFKKLSISVAKHPLEENEKELMRVFTMFESFFYIYTRWQDECSNIDENNFKQFSNNMENEIKTLIKVWENNI